MKHIYLPEDLSILTSLVAGEEVAISGVVFTARDAAHKRIADMIEKGEQLPVDLKDSVVFYAGPTPPKPGATTCAVGPTTSTRMDPFTPMMLDLGVRCVIGKGKRSPRVKEALKEHGAVYLIMVGGIAAYLSKHIESMEVAGFADLGTEAIHRFVVRDLPCIVGVDTEGRDVYDHLSEKL